ncbi:MAG: hypothetical protein COW54_08210 [Rhodobacteraceae bacterium CG17_big_fil_post_rev_8_21_14_2_50_63_15]|nr:hypothetical protein [Roseovarius sp.]PIV78642.1 MAG: hypothetical protein COW54_08210 [Rhodobacteraceae bacterium CG17_big_fil_post_rev_8_21_14_2_50_63_15]
MLEHLRRDKDPKSAIVGAFHLMLCGGETSPGGCLMVNSAIERAPHDPQIAAIIETSMQQVQDFFAEGLNAARANGDLSNQTNIDETAKVLHGLMVGLLVLLRANPDSSVPAAVSSRVRNIFD